MDEAEGGQVENHLGFYSGLLPPCSGKIHRLDWAPREQLAHHFLSFQFLEHLPLLAPCPLYHPHSCSHSPNFFSVSTSSSIGKIQLLPVQGRGSYVLLIKGHTHRGISTGSFSIFAGARDEQRVDAVLDLLPTAAACNTKHPIYRGAENTW